jgi:urease accessory protein
MIDTRVMHLADSGLPTGAYVYSNGLESAAKMGLFQNRADFAAYLKSVVQQFASFDMPFIASCYGLPDLTVGPALSNMLREYDAATPIPSIHRASITQGETWLRVLDGFYPDCGIAALIRGLREAKLPAHYTLAFGLSLRLAGYTLETAADLYQFCGVRDQISVAVRLGLFGPTEGHRLLHEFCGANVAPDANADYRDAVRLCPLLDIAQARHPQVYAKLFQN